MNFYAYKGKAELGKEPLGTFDKMIIKGLKTVSGAKRRAVKRFGKDYRIFRFTNFYGNKTFTEV